MTRAHAPDCGAFFAGRCDCAVGALEAAEQRAVAALAQVEHFRRRMEEADRRANEHLGARVRFVTEAKARITALREDLAAMTARAEAAEADARGVRETYAEQRRTVEQLRAERALFVRVVEAAHVSRLFGGEDNVTPAVRKALDAMWKWKAAAAAARPPGARTSAASAEEGSGATPASAADTSAAPVGQTCRECNALKARADETLADLRAVAGGRLAGGEAWMRYQTAMAAAWEAEKAVVEHTRAHGQPPEAP